MLLMLAALGALRFLQTFLFALHLMDPELNRALFLIGASALFFGAAVIGVRRSGTRNVESALGLRIPQLPDLAVGIPVGIGLYFLTTAVQQFINSHFATWVDWYTPARSPFLLGQGPWFMISLLALIIVPMGEESLFRGFLHRGLRTRFKLVTATVLSAGLFAISHYDPAIMPAIFVGGVVLALAFEWRRTLAMPMVIHSTINACFLIGELLG
jgi:membrane protease YdiL (CAAX protease family)